AYVREHELTIKAEAITTAIEINRLRPLFEQNREQFRRLVTIQSGIRGLAVMEMIDKELNVIERADIPINLTFAKPSREALVSVTEDDAQIANLLDGNYLIALIKLGAYTDTYLYIVRLLDPRVVEQLRTTQQDVDLFGGLLKQRYGVQNSLALLYTVI